jgi:Tol biopolymer transport system component
MSPEQVRGEKAGAPSDIFSLGSVLYEMLAGKSPFASETYAETMAATLRDGPPRLADAGKDVPAELEMIVAHCLEKRAQERFHSARDLSFALHALGSGSKASLPLARPKPRGRPAAWRSIMILLAIASLFPLILYFSPTQEERSSISFDVSLPGAWIATELGNRFLAVSPDGQQLAFVVESEGQRMLWVRPRDSVQSAPMAGTEGATSPFWSSDSRWIGFFAGGKLQKINASGGPPQTLCEVSIGTVTGTWNGEGTILFAGEGGGSEGIYRVSDGGGEPVPVIRPDPSRNQLFLFWPKFLPDGRHFLYLASNEKRKGEIVFIGSLDIGEVRPLIEISSLVEYAPPGYLLYVREGALLAHPFDAAMLKFTGEPAQIAEQVQYFNPTGHADFSASQSLIAYRAGKIASQLKWFDRNGRELGAVGTAGQYEEPRLSPDERKVAVGLVDPKTGTLDIWILDLTRDLSTRITAARPSTAYGPVWSADGSTLAFVTDPDGPPHLYKKMATGAGDLEMLLPPGEVQYADDWSADGRYITYAELGPGTRMDLWIMPLFGDRKPFPFVNTPFNEKEARFSPDGRRVAYVSDESGKNEVYVQSLQSRHEKWRISTAGGSQPVWRRDGKELFYLAADNKIMAVPVKVGRTFEAGVPVSLFRIDPAAEHAYDVTSDGQRFLVNTSLMRKETLPITVVINWSADLKR